MVNVLIDTCVVSEVQRPQGDPRVRAAFELLDNEQMYFSVITIGEIARGLSLLAPGRRRTSLVAWLAEIESNYEDRILPVDLEVAKIWAEESARNSREGRTVADADGLIAATAIRFQMPVMTRNVRHFRGAEIINPWDD
jgi:predicted nucleic acid-binding protein